MKFKENAIKPGMIINCKLKVNAEALFEYLGALGYTWIDDEPLEQEKTRWDDFGNETVYVIDKNTLSITYCGMKMYNDKLITDFYDLLEIDADDLGGTIEWPDSPTDSPTDSPMTAVEIIQWFSDADMHTLAEVFDGWRSAEEIFLEFEPDEIIEQIEAYEKKKNESKTITTEWGSFCEIYKILNAGTAEEVIQKLDVVPLADGDDMEEAAAEMLKLYAEKYDEKLCCMISRMCIATKGE